MPASLFVVRTLHGGRGLYVTVVSLQAGIWSSVSFIIFNLCVRFPLTLSHSPDCKATFMYLYY